MHLHLNFLNSLNKLAQTYVENDSSMKPIQNFFQNVHAFDDFKLQTPSDGYPLQIWLAWYSPIRLISSSYFNQEYSKTSVPTTSNF